MPGLLAGLDDRLQLLTGGRQDAARHRSMRAVIEWSHDLLDDDERTVFRRLAVFVGGFDFEAAVAVAGDGLRPAAVADVVGRLVDKSLVVRRRTPVGDRWRLLETVRAFALERLAQSDDEVPVRERHLAWATDLGRALEQRMDDDEPWAAEFDVVVDDLRGALPSTPAQPNAIAFSLALAVGHMLYARRFPAEAEVHYRTAADLAPDDHSAARALHGAANVSFARMRSDEAYPTLLAAAERYLAAGDRSGATIAYATAVIWGQRFPGEFDVPIALDESERVLQQARDASPADDAVAAAWLLTASAWPSAGSRPVADRQLATQALHAAARDRRPGAVEQCAGCARHVVHRGRRDPRGSAPRLRAARPVRPDGPP